MSHSLRWRLGVVVCQGLRAVPLGMCQKRPSPEQPLGNPWTQCDQWPHLWSQAFIGVLVKGLSSVLPHTVPPTPPPNPKPVTPPVSPPWACIKLRASCLCLEVSTLAVPQLGSSLPFSELPLAQASETYATSLASFTFLNGLFVPISVVIRTALEGHAGYYLALL